MTELAAADGTTTMRRDIASAYVVTAARVLSWVVVSAVVYRRIGADAFGTLALVRATIGLLNYTSLGLAPAMVNLISRAARPVIEARHGSRMLSYATPVVGEPLRRIYASGAAAAALAAAIGLIVTLVYALLFQRLHAVPNLHGDDIVLVVALMGIGTVLRLASDAPGAILQTSARIARDNTLIAMSELAWAAFVLVVQDRIYDLAVVPFLYMVSGALLLFARSIAASRIAGPAMFNVKAIDPGAVRTLFSFGLLVTVAQLADFLYAPTDYILINHFFGAASVAVYAPAVQIDAGLLLLVTALAGVLLPKAALAHAANDPQTVRKYYIHGTLASLAVLTAAAVCVWLLSPWILRLWLGDPMIRTQRLLPLVLIHTVVGGSSAVGRSILLGIGKVKPFTISVLIAGVANVMLSYVFVRYFDLGLRGIVLGTIIVVVARAGIWMPWYVLKTLRTAQPAEPIAVVVPPPPAVN